MNVNKKLFFPDFFYTSNVEKKLREKEEMLMRTVTNFSKVIIIIAVLSLAYAMVPTSAQAQAVGQTEVRVVVPPLLILYYYSVLEVTLSADDITLILAGVAGSPQAIDPLGGATKSVALTGWAADADIATDVGALGALGTQTATITNAWGYFAVGNPANPLRATLAENGAASALTLEGTNGGTIDLSNFQIQSGAVTWGTTLNGLTKGGGVRTGDLRFDMDLSNIVDAGTYQDSGPVWQFQITLEYV
jgi:hypothetical protein